jgi:hypothetical protein
MNRMMSLVDDKVRSSFGAGNHAEMKTKSVRCGCGLVRCRLLVYRSRAVCMQFAMICGLVDKMLSADQFEVAFGSRHAVGSIANRQRAPKAGQLPTTMYIYRRGYLLDDEQQDITMYCPPILVAEVFETPSSSMRLSELVVPLLHNDSRLLKTFRATQTWQQAQTSVKDTAGHSNSRAPQHRPGHNHKHTAQNGQVCVGDKCPPSFKAVILVHPTPFGCGHDLQTDSRAAHHYRQTAEVDFQTFLSKIRQHNLADVQEFHVEARSARPHESRPMHSISERTDDDTHHEEHVTGGQSEQLEQAQVGLDTATDGLTPTPSMAQVAEEPVARQVGDSSTTRTSIGSDVETGQLVDGVSVDSSGQVGE